MRKILFCISASAAMFISQIAMAETVKIGFVTTLTGGAGAIGSPMSSFNYKEQNHYCNN